MHYRPPVQAPIPTVDSIELINTAGVVNGSDLDIQLVADYEGMLHDINVSQGLIEHSESNAAADLLKNFAYHVFTSVEGNNSIGVEESKDKIGLDIFPNPSNGNLNIQNPTQSEVEVVVYNSMGADLVSNC